MPVQITALVPSLRDEFMWIDGMNRATDGPASPWWQTVLSSDGPIPTEYLSQVPRDWPYTEYGVKRKIGLVASWPFVHPNATSVTVAWLFYGESRGGGDVKWTAGYGCPGQDTCESDDDSCVDEGDVAWRVEWESAIDGDGYESGVGRNDGDGGGDEEV
ncbi:hypothetical protein SNOG_12924 [Parastagonospora nodorum SN15]|uniref:Uncharacterized protein n=1 Tax=Phaeosphaeria nodorum (strain SN15 / ATCC MYA-4574 / FGSC 10173) TaxID=321614 RepID=Q0U5P0_PHANO|nr:hypothetical protein SNOG_12924 [Parastagonospora nodorum SN15]EAT79724.1 hypothetical protein SNOG_12924 [Parastagonospora nodorum SN15]